MFNHRLRIFSSLLIAFVIVKIYANFTDVKNLLINFKLPSYNFGKLFTLNFDSQPQIGSENPTPTNRLNPISSDSIQFNLSSPVPTQSGLGNPTPTSRLYPTPSDFIRFNPSPTKFPTKIPTNKPKPTNTPKPTKTPTPPPITSDVRPGTTLSEIFQEVGKRACIPPALLRAIQEKETGAWWSFNSPSSKVKIYNTYGWWITGAGNPCTGFGYHTQTGVVPQDSVNAGYSCQNSVGASGDIKVMGLLQVSEEEQTLTRKYTKPFIPGNFDRRVIFDNALIFAIATKNRIGTTPKSCTDWPDEVVLTAAETHIGRGSCSAQNYCKEVLRLYKLYR